MTAQSNATSWGVLSKAMFVQKLTDVNILFVKRHSAYIPKGKVKIRRRFNEVDDIGVVSRSRSQVWTGQITSASFSKSRQSIKSAEIAKREAEVILSGDQRKYAPRVLRRAERLG